MFIQSNRSGRVKTENIGMQFSYCPAYFINSFSDQRDDEANRRFMGMIPEEPEEEEEDSEFVSFNVINNDWTCLLVKQDNPDEDFEPTLLRQ